MFNVYRKEVEFGGRTLSFETGKIARQAAGSVVTTYGDSTVMANVTGAQKVKEGQDFFPLTVHYQEKAYAAGKIPGGFFKREGRPSEKETLTARLIDRPIRPLFIDGFYNEVLVMCTVLGHDLVNDTDVIAINATSAALTISGMPFMGPLAAARVGYIDGEYILNPTAEQMQETELDLVVAGTREGVMMVESQANELSEEVMLGAVQFGWQGFQCVIDTIIELAEMCAKEPWEIAEPSFDKKSVKADISKLVGKDLEAAYKEQDKQTRSNKIAEAKDKVIETMVSEEEGGLTLLDVSNCFKSVEADLVRGQILDTKKRIDGRDTKTVRQIVAEVNTLPGAHGSALFTRGETQALAVATLGTGQDEQIIDALEGEYKESFLLHYNFPPYSVGEARRVGPPGRREIGHGKLAWRALKPVLPSKDEFPYTMRVVSEVTESNGSSSQASVCGASLALMDAGVPLKKPVAGIAMGLIKDGDKFAVLSDILGDEDHLGDMDFKVAGTDAGITALQMDIKITSVTEEIMTIALDQAKEGRLHILQEMSKALNTARDDVSSNAPRITQLKINPDKIRDVIGTGGKVIREICETTGAKIDIEDDGTIKVAAVDQEAAQKAIDWIKSITDEPELNHIYTGKVVKVVDFGAFVNFMGAKDGLVHISQIKNERINSVSDFLSEGDEVKVKVIGFDDRGKIKLSMKVVDQETGEDISDKDEDAA